MTRLASWTMEANTLSFYRSLGKEPPAWDFLPTAAQFICASTAALCTNGADETSPGDRQALGARSSAPGALQPRQEVKHPRKLVRPGRELGEHLF